MRAGSSNSRCKLVLNTRDFGTSIRSVGPMEKLDARAVEFASPVQDELIQALCGVYNKVGSWNGKSYYEKAPTPDDVEGQPSFAMWFTMAPILAGEDELVAGYSWLVTPKDDIATVWASVWQGEEDTSLCPLAEGWGAAGDDSTWLASVHACVPAATEPTVEKKDKATKRETVPRGSVAAEVADFTLPASSTEPTVEKKDKAKKRETVPRGSVAAEVASRFQHRADSRDEGQGQEARDGHLPASAKACAVPPPPPPPVKGKGMGKGDAGGDAGGWYMAPGGQPQWRPHDVTAAVAHGPKPPMGPPPGWAADKGRGKTAAEKKSRHASSTEPTVEKVKVKKMPTPPSTPPPRIDKDKVKKMPTQPATPPPRKKRNVYVSEDGIKMMTVVDEAGNAMERKYVRDTEELRAAMEMAIADADKDEAKKRAERDAQPASGPESSGRRRHRSFTPERRCADSERPVVPMIGVRQRDNKGRKRGGWYNRCQLTMEAVLSGNMDIAIQLSEKFYGGQNEF